MGASLATSLHKLVHEMDRAANRLLIKEFGISYKRAYFLLVLQQYGTVTQHELAIALGFSDPSVSIMLLELTKAGYLTVTPSAKHGRKRLVTLTPQGETLITAGLEFMDTHFSRVVETAQINAEIYQAFTEKLYKALISKKEEEIA
jgi:DNA-binding MarR family transcriptional regulator